MTILESNADLSTTPENRSTKAKRTWSKVALKSTSNVYRKEIQLDAGSTSIYNQRLWEEFCSIKGTYYINGLASCRIGDRLIHPFEAHGYCKSFIFDGNGRIHYTSNIVNTPITDKERISDRIINRGVMSTVASLDSILGYIRNAVSSSERDTANLTADLWPPPGTKNKDGIEPILIACADNGEPFALDPSTLETKGRLVDIIPKLKSAFPDGTKFLAHNRYDEERNRLILCVYKMIIPGQDFLGNTQMEFVELDDNFDVVSRREFTTRFMVFHDWALTENYYVVPKNPAFLRWINILKFAFGLTLGTDVFAMEEETNGEFILIPRHDNGKEVKTATANSFFNCFHFGPVYEKANDELVVHGCVFDSYTFGGEMGFDSEQQIFSPIEWGSCGLKTNGARSPPPRLDRFVIDTDTFEIKSRERVPCIPVDMPNFYGDSKPCKYSYFLGAERPEGWFPFRQIVKLNCDTFESFVYDAGDGQVASEPMFLPRGNSKTEDDGFLISIIHDAENTMTKMAVWETQSFEKGPIGECVIGELIPWCVHGSFYSGFIP
jgi:all-trans-8'-apo-beta-carotenal 15,15'-oxygenase